MRYAALAVLALAACSNPVENTGKPQGIEVPDDGSIVALSPDYEVLPEGLSFMTLGGSTSGSGHLAMSCSLTSTGRRCQLLWAGASATSLIAVATCVTQGAVSCAGAIVAMGYAWDAWAREPDCQNCNSPFSYENSGNWNRYDKYTWPFPPEDDGAL